MNAVTPLKILHTAANNATPGVWGILSVTSSVSVRAVVNLNGGGTSRNIVCKLTPSAWRPYDEMRRDANFIALANPATIITLLDRLEAAEARGAALEAELAALRGEQEPVGYIHDHQLSDLLEGNATVVKPNAAFNEAVKLFTTAPKPVVVLTDCDKCAVSHMAHWYSEDQCEAWVAGVEYVKQQVEAAGCIVKVRQ